MTQPLIAINRRTEKKCQIEKKNQNKVHKKCFQALSMNGGRGKRESETNKKYPTENLANKKILLA